MEKPNTFLKEWNSVVEALGHGKQTILIRKYDVSYKTFLLYPTTRYTKSDNFIKSFQNKYHYFIEKNSVPFQKENKIQIKYLINIEKIEKVKIENINSLEDYYIWTKEHVNEYLKNKDAYVWILRTYKLKEPFMTKIVPGLRYSKITQNPNIKKLDPIINEEEFSIISKQIKNLIN